MLREQILIRGNLLLAAIVGAAAYMFALAEPPNPEREVLSVNVEGEINQQVVAHLFEYDGQDIIVRLNSFGGRVDDSLNLAELIKRNRWPLVVDGFCISSCAEILLLASKDISLQPGALVGFHGNSLLKNHLYRQASGDSASRCFLNFEDRQNALYQYSGVREDFWRQQKKYLNPTEVRLYSEPNAKCARLSIVYDRSMWFPTTDQLRTLYGLNFYGTTLADDLLVTTQLLTWTYRDMGRVVIGETEVDLDEN